MHREINMSTAPDLLYNQLFIFGSLKNVEQGVQFSIENRFNDLKITGLTRMIIDGKAVQKENVWLDRSEETTPSAAQLSAHSPLYFPSMEEMDILLHIETLPKGKHKIEIVLSTEPLGNLKINVEDDIHERDTLLSIPRDRMDNYSGEIVRERQQFVEKFTAMKLQHTTKYSFDPGRTRGNIENFTGVAQVPLGFAGPLKVNGEHAQGEFLIPLATSEGTLVASYNRGMKILNHCGGVKCTVVGDAMQRAPVFVFEDARSGRDFVKWIDENLDKIREVAEATSSVARLQYIDSILANKFVYLRFNFFTGDAAGQNMVGRATLAACDWILGHYKGIKDFYLESNFATDKKTSQINILRTRGKRVTAEAILKRDMLIQHGRVEPERLKDYYGVGNIGTFLSGANNNGLHSTNAITAMFIATGQDVANVSESSAAILYAELTHEKDLYISITLPSLIVGTYGGGTGLPTQRECLEILGAYGKGKVNRLAEIIAGVVLAGEISLACAILSSDWVLSHEKYGRNR